MAGSITRFLVRASVYIAVVVLVAELEFLEARLYHGERMYSEWGHIETAQSLVLLGCVIVSALTARIGAGWRELSVLLALGFSMLLIRENDQVLELFLPHGVWKYPAGLVFLVGAWYGWRHRVTVVEQLGRWSGTLSFGVMMSGFMVLLYARLFGRTSFWQAVMSEQYVRRVKNAAEEGTELMALAILAVAMGEWLRLVLRSRRG